MKPSEKVDILRKSSIFSILTEVELVKLSRLAKERSLKSGEFLIREEERCEYFYILTEGKLRTFLYSSLGKELTLITYLRPGEILGPNVYFPGSPSLRVHESSIADEGPRIQKRTRSFRSFLATRWSCSK